MKEKSLCDDFFFVQYCIAFLMTVELMRKILLIKRLWSWSPTELPTGKWTMSE